MQKKGKITGIAIIICIFITALASYAGETITSRIRGGFEEATVWGIILLIVGGATFLIIYLQRRR